MLLISLGFIIAFFQKAVCLKISKYLVTYSVSLRGSLFYAMMNPMKKLERWNQVLLILNPFDISSGFLMERHLSLKIQVSMILVLFQREVKS